MAALDLDLLALSPSVASIIVSAELSGCSGAELGTCVQHSVSIEMSLKKCWWGGEGAAFGEEAVRVLRWVVSAHGAIPRCAHQLHTADSTQSPRDIDT